MKYAAFYCEENVWHLCREPAIAAPVEDRHVVFVSNAARRVAMTNQRAGNGDVTEWDYHVVLVARGEVWDLDCTLGAPLPLAVWIAASFVEKLGPPPRFRIVRAPAFLEAFASDRSHMAGSAHAPPPWPPIGQGMTLDRFVDMTHPFVGEVVDLALLLARLG